MTTWIHFTKDGRNFELTAGAGESISREYDGLFVYKFDDDFPLEERRQEWAYRDVIFVSCDDRFVEFIQDDPLGDDPSRNEYLIPARHFDKCRYWQE